MRKLIISMIVPTLLFGQTKENKINPSGKWFFGAEIGNNLMISLKLGEPYESFQGGISAEYYFARHWSLSTKIKYFETGVSYFIPFKKGISGGYFFDGTSDIPEQFGTFEGAQITVPIFLKWEFRLVKNFSGNIKIGPSGVFETKSCYNNYSIPIDSSNYPTNYYGTAFGVGFNYFVNKQLSVYFDSENFFGENKGTQFSTDQSVVNKNNSIGIKYNFKK